MQEGIWAGVKMLHREKAPVRTRVTQRRVFVRRAERGWTEGNSQALEGNLAKENVRVFLFPISLTMSNLMLQLQLDRSIWGGKQGQISHPWSIHYVLGTDLDVGETLVNETKSLP